MKKAIFTMSLAVIVGVAGFVQMAKAPATTTPTQEAIITLSPKEFLKAEVQKQGLADRDFLILHEIIRCESSWSQVWERDYAGHVKGEVKVANGNIGLGQINRTAHHEEYERLALDPFDELENLTYTVILYKRGGITAWETWSGHCFLPALAEKGITF